MLTGHSERGIEMIGRENLETRLKFIDEFQRRIQQHCRKIVRKVAKPLELERVEERDERLERIEQLARNLEQLYRKKHVEERRKKEPCPVLDIVIHDNNHKENLLKEQTRKIFKSEYKKKILSGLEENEQTRRRELLIEKLKKVEYYERKNQQMKWSSHNIL